MSATYAEVLLRNSFTETPNFKSTSPPPIHINWGINFVIFSSTMMGIFVVIPNGLIALCSNPVNSADSFYQN